MKLSRPVCAIAVLACLGALCATVILIILSYQSTRPEETFEPDPPQDLPLSAHFDYAYHDDWDGLLERRYIRILTTVNRTNFFIADGRLAGYEYEKLQKFKKHINRAIPRRDLQVVLEFIPVSRDDLLPLLRAGYGDIAAGMLTITPQRQHEVAFTIPYLSDINEVIVTHRDGFHPQKLEDLSGCRIFVRIGSSYYESLQDVNIRLAAQGLDPVLIVPADNDLETETILELVNAGAVEMTVADSHIAALWAQILPDIVVHADVAVRSGGEIAWAVRRENPELLAQINSFLEKHRQGTLLGNIYFQRYFNNISRLQNPADPENRARLERYTALIRQYTDQYDVDWLLIMALAFQESGLNHARRSPAGAVGLLQVLPATGADPRIGIPDVWDLEHNIHAGIKFFALLYHSYFQDPNISPDDRIRFALASYNAGPTQINRARRVAADMGLDPDIWYRNVELGALKIIGQETVRYVSNINTYYILYHMMMERDSI